MIIGLEGEDPTTISDEFLQTYGCVVNVTHKILICLECRHIIDPENVRKHMLNKHKEVDHVKDLDDKFRKWAVDHQIHLTFKPEQPKVAVEPIFGLEPPEKNLQLCNNCHRAFQGNDQEKDKPSPTFSHHKCIAGVPNPQGRSMSITFGQRFLNNNKSPWFPVFGPLEAVNHQKSAWQSYCEQRASRPPAPTEISLPGEYRILHQFLQKERWIDHVKGKDHNKLVSLVTIRSNDVCMPRLHRHIHAFLVHEQAKLSGFLIRRLIGTRPT
jgi:hypothetical protein